MSYPELEPDFNFAINSAPNFVPTFSESKSESNFESECDFSSMLMNLDICIFWRFIYTLLNKFGDVFVFSIFITESIVMQAIKI